MKLLHISDIHIGNGPRDEYLAAFAQIADIPKHDTITVITGDIFHTQTINALHIELFDTLIASCGPAVVIIPGNHDINWRNSAPTDTLGAILAHNPRYAHCRYSSRTERFSYASVNFYHKSARDDDSTIQHHPGDVVLYHGMLRGAKHNGHMASTQDPFNISSARLVLCGDIHRAQFVAPHCGYAGSLIAQNAGETEAKGYILWDLHSATGTFCALKATHAIVRAEVATGESAEQYAQRVIATAGQQSIKRLTVIDNASRTNQSFIQRVAEIIGCKTHRVNQRSVRESSFDAHIAATLIDRPTLHAAVSKLHEQYTSTTVRTAWYIESIQFDNMYRYGRGNNIDLLTAGDGALIGIVAPNAMGKSSLFDIICYMLFNKTIRGDITSILRIGQHEARCKLILATPAARYEITRIIRPRKPEVYITNVTTGEDHSDTVANSYQFLETIVGTLESFTAANMLIPAADVITVDNTARRRIFCNLFNLGDFNAIRAAINREINDIDLTLARMPRSNTVDPIAQRAATQAQLDSARARLQSLESVHGSGPSRATLQAKLQNIQYRQYQYESQHITPGLINTRHPATIQAELQRLLQPPTPPAPTTYSPRTHAEIRAKLATMGTPAPCTRPTMTLEAATAQRAALLQSRPIPPDLAPFRARVAQLEQSTELEFNTRCQQCSHNIDILCADLAAAQNALTAAQATALQMAPIIAEHETKIAQIDEIISAHAAYTTYTEYTKWQRCLEMRDLALKQTDAAQRTAYDAYTARKQVLEWELHNAIGAENDKVYRHNVQCDNDKQALTAQLQYADDTPDNTLQINALYQEIGRLSATLATLDSAIEAESKYSAHAEPLLQRSALLTAYRDCISPAGIATYLSSYLSQLIDYTNEILGNCGDFKLIASVNDKNMEFKLQEGPNTLHVELTSGYQRFVIGLALRIALTQILPHVPKLLLIDEGFGCLDPVNLERVKTMLTTYREQFKYILCVSHIDDLHNIFTSTLSIQSVGGASYVGNIVATPPQDDTFTPTPDGKRYICKYCKDPITPGRRTSHLQSATHARNKRKAGVID